MECKVKCVSGYVSVKALFLSKVVNGSALCYNWPQYGSSCALNDG